MYYLVARTHGIKPRCVRGTAIHSQKNKEKDGLIILTAPRPIYHLEELPQKLRGVQDKNNNKSDRMDHDSVRYSFTIS